MRSFYWSAIDYDVMSVTTCLRWSRLVARRVARKRKGKKLVFRWIDSLTKRKSISRDTFDYWQLRLRWRQRGSIFYWQTNVSKLLSRLFITSATHPREFFVSAVRFTNLAQNNRVLAQTCVAYPRKNDFLKKPGQKSDEKMNLEFARANS